LGQAQKCGRVEPVNGIPTLLILIILSPAAIQMQKTSADSLLLKKSTHNKMNEYINMDSTIAWSVHARS
jgi:hypothetical protein